MEPLKIAFVLCGLTFYTSGAPASQDQHAGTPPLLTVKDDNVGDNFLGFKVSPGVGGVLKGDKNQGLDASAGTTLIQNGDARMGGQINRGKREAKAPQARCWPHPKRSNNKFKPRTPPRPRPRPYPVVPNAPRPKPTAPA